LPILSVVTDSGWFADPGGKVNTFRWWNGEAWTRWLSADPTAHDPGPDSSPAEGGPAPADSETMATEAPDLAAFAPPNPADRVVPLSTAAALVAGVVLLLIIAVGGIVSLTADRPLSGPPVNPPPRTRTPLKVSYDSATRKVSFEEMQFVAPGRPFFCGLGPREVPGTFTSAFGCAAPVHRNYDKLGNDWVAAVTMGHLDDRLRQSGDLPKAASRTFAALLPADYGMTKYTVKQQRIQNLTGVAPPGKGVLLSAQVHLAEPGLATKYDHVVLVVVELQSGEQLAWYAARPNDSPKDVTEALQSSANTLTAR
jgi:Protein of unknown function (DUF2510)